MTPRIHNFFSLVPKYKLLLGSFIFLSLYSGALYTFATTYVSPGTILDPVGIPGSYTVTPPLTYGGAVTSGHDGEILYIDGSGNLVSDALFVREAATGNFLVAQSFGLDEFASFQLNDTKQSAQMAYNNTATGERAQISTGGGPIQVDASYEDGVSILGEFILANGGNTLAWDADTTDDLSDFFIQAQNISGAGINGTLIGHSDSNTQEHAISAWGDFTGQGGQAFQAITSVGSGDIEVGHTVSPANGYQISYQDIGINTTANLTLDGNANRLTFNADTTDTITYGLEQDENILGLGLVSGSFNYYEDTNTDLVTMSGSGDFTPGGGNPATSIILTKSTTTDDIAGFQTSYDPGFPEMTAIGQVVNGTNQASLVLNSTDSDLIFSPDSGTSMSGMTANSISAYIFRDGGSTVWAAGIGDGLFQVQDITNNKLYFKVDITNGLYQLGDIDGAGNSTLFTIDDAATEISASVDNKFLIKNLSGDFTALNANPGGHVISFGDTDGNFNGTYLTVDDSVSAASLHVDGGFNISDVVGNSWLYVAPGSHVVSIGDYQGTFNGTYLTVDDSNKTTTASVDSFFNIQNEIGEKYFQFSDNANSVAIGDINGAGNNMLLLVDDANQAISMSDGSGTVVFYIDGSASPSTDIKIGDIGGNGNTTYMFIDDANHLTKFNANSSGNIVSATNTDGTCTLDPGNVSGWSCPSDRNLKKDISTLQISALDSVNQLSVVNYRLINEDESILLSTGLIAQDVQIIPEFQKLVSNQSDGTLSLNYGGFTPYLIKAVQELDLKIKPLEDLLSEGNTFAEILRTFLASATNGITSIFSREVVTDRICVRDEAGQTCLTRSELDSLIQGGGAGSTSGSSGGSGGGSGTTNTTGDTTTTTSSTTGDSSGGTTDGTTSGDTTGLGDTGSTTGGDSGSDGATTGGEGDTGSTL